MKGGARANRPQRVRARHGGAVGGGGGGVEMLRFDAHWWPCCGMGKSGPRSPSTLLAEIHLTESLLNAIERSAANCSPSQSETSQPVTSTSIALCESRPSSRAVRRCLRQQPRCHAVSRLSEMPYGAFQSS